MSDDYWKVNKTEVQLKLMVTQGYDFSHTTYHVINQNGKVVGTIKAREILEYKKLLQSCDVGLSSVILKRELLNNIKFSELKTKEDFVLWLSLAKKSVILFGIDEPLMFWRQTPNSLSSSIL